MTGTFPAARLKQHQVEDLEGEGEFLWVSVCVYNHNLFCMGPGL